VKNPNPIRPRITQRGFINLDGTYIGAKTRRQRVPMQKNKKSKNLF
jgi:hypothetical protein